MSSAPYSVKSLSADTAANAANATTAATAANATQLNGQTASFYQDATNINAGTLNAARLPVPLTLSGTSATHIIRGDNDSTAVGAAGVFGTAIGSSGATFGGRFDNGSTDGFGVYGLAYNNSGQNYGVYGKSFGSSGAGVFGSSGSSGATFGGRFESNSTNGTGVFGRAGCGTGTTVGVYGQSISSSGIGGYFISPGVGLQAESSGNDAVYARTSAAGRSGVFGYNTAGSGINYGVGGRSESPSGFGGFFTSPGVGVRAESSGNDAVYAVASAANKTGVYGYHNATSGTNYGVGGRSESPSGFGGFFSSPGVGLQAESSGNDGVYATTSVAGRSGVYGINTATSGLAYGVAGISNSSNGRGVLGRVTSLGGPTNVYGVYGDASGSFGFGVYSLGNTGATGTKQFRIDHPDDPENKYLLHYSSESPEVINFYSGKVMLNAEGEAVVELPAYFAKINRDPRYMLTAVGSSDAHAARGQGDRRGRPECRREGRAERSSTQMHFPYSGRRARGQGLVAGRSRSQ